MTIIIFAYTTHLSYLSVITCFIPKAFDVIYTLLRVLVIVYYHRIAMLCFLYHIKSYTFHIHFFCIIFSFSFIFMPANTFEADTGNNYMYPKVLSLYEIVISIRVYPKVLSLYETVVFICIYPKVSSLYETVTYAMYYVVTLSGPP